MGSIALVDPPRDEVVRIALAPGGLRLTTTVALAFGRRARSLASSDSPVREKPLPTKSTRALSASSGHPLASPPLPGSRLRSRFASWLGSPAPPPCVTSRERGSSCPSQLTCSSLDPMLQEQREVCFPLIHATSRSRGSCHPQGRNEVEELRSGLTRPAAEATPTSNYETSPDLFSRAHTGHFS